MNIMNKKMTFGVIVSTRGFFNPDLSAEARRALLEKLLSLGYEYVIPPENATLNGAIETLSDARKCAETLQNNKTKIDGIIVCLPNFSDELGVVQTLDMGSTRLNLRETTSHADGAMHRQHYTHCRFLRFFSASTIG